jgi:lysophospholipase L1-like esterase
MVWLGPALACSSKDSNGAAVDAGHDDVATDAASEARPAALIARANPIISRGKTTVPAGPAANVDNTTYHDGGWSIPIGNLPASVAINLGAGPTRLLVQWDDGGTYDYKDPAGTVVYGLPRGYTIDVSGDTSNGTDGTWTTQVTVDDNAVRTRGHAVDFTGMSWVRLTITAAPPTISGNGIQIGEIDVHDISATGAGMPDDTWFFMGDSITAFAYDRAAAHQPSFAAGVHAAKGDFFPAMINGGIGGETSAAALARLPDALALNPDYRFFVLGYGTNDVNRGSTTAFQANMQMMIEMVKAAGHIPLIPRIPYSTAAGYTNTAPFNDIVDALVASNSLLAAPDFYAHFMAAGAGEYTCPPCNGRATDNLHPNDLGLAAMNRLWTEAALPLYP